MSEQALKPSPEPEVHDQITGKIKEAGENLPRDVVSRDTPLGGMTRIDSEAGYVQHSEADDTSPDTVIGYVRMGGSVSDANTEGAYEFRSVKGEGVEGATVVMRQLKLRDGITRRGSQHYNGPAGEVSSMGSYVYEHEFKPEVQGKAGELVTDIVIKQAARSTPPVERV